MELLLYAFFFPLYMDIPLFTVDIPTLTRQTLRWKSKKSLKSSNNLDIPKAQKRKLTISLHGSVRFPIVLGFF
jgi:hypothetical protein